MRHLYFYSECEGVGNIKSLTSSHSFCFIPIRFQRKIVRRNYVYCVLNQMVARYMESHLTQVRESKCAGGIGLHGAGTSPLTQVRESKCNTDPDYNYFSGRTSRRCANRNLVSVGAGVACHCRTSRRCANRNSLVLPRKSKKISRTSHGCANRNQNDASALVFCFLSHLTQVRESKFLRIHNAPDTIRRTSRGCVN